MAETSERIIKPVEILVAKNLPISNTGRVTLLVKPPGSGPSIDIVVEPNHSALLVPGNYVVVPAIGANSPPIAEISYDRELQHFNVKVLRKLIPVEAQFSVLVNLTDLVVGPK